jgi:hypothetical protein
MPARSLLASALCIALAGASRAAEPPPPPPEAENPEPAPSARPGLDLDRLLRVPLGGPVAVEQPGGRDRGAWQTEFASVRSQIAELERSIAAAQERLRANSPDDWGFAPPGAGGAPMDPEVLKLRAELRRDRESLEAARQRLRDLEVEASLAGVPEAWTRPEPEPPPAAGTSPDATPER